MISIIYSDITKFKLIINSKKKMVIKIPTKYKNQKESMKWINRCSEIMEKLENFEIPFTLRGQTKIYNIEELNLKTEHRIDRKIKTIARFKFIFKEDKFYKIKTKMEILN